VRRLRCYFGIYHTYVPIIDNLGGPFSRWVADQLRRHSAQTTMTFGRQLVTDAALAVGERPTERDALTAAERMERSAPW